MITAITAVLTLGGLYATLGPRKMNYHHCHHYRYDADGERNHHRYHHFWDEKRTGEQSSPDEKAK